MAPFALRLFVVITCAIAIGCKPRASSSLLESDTPTTPISPEPRNDGVSDFDRIFKPGLTTSRLPTTFASLVSRIEAATRGERQVTMIPFGRSLARAVTDARDPRIVVAIRNDANARLATDSVDTHAAPIFLGYAKKPGTVEVISYNEQEGRFDFELIDNLAPAAAPSTTPTTPTVRYADRRLCLACHKSETPLFSAGLWSETLDHNPTLLERVRVQHRARNFIYEGFALPDEAIEQFVPPGQAFEDFAIEAYKRLTLNKIWRDTCKGQPQCRADLALFALLASSGLNQTIPALNGSETFRRAARHFAGLVQTVNGGAINNRSPTIVNRDPTQEPTPLAGQDPLRAEFGAISTLRSDDATNLFWTIVSNDQFGGLFLPSDASRFRTMYQGLPGASADAKLSALAASWSSQTWATQDNAPFRRCDIVGTLPGPSLACSPASGSWRAAASSDIAPQASEFMGHQAFQTHCASCHQSETGPLPHFLLPSAGVSARSMFARWAHCIVPTLRWDESATAPRMPPEAARAALSQAPDTRALMLAAAQQAADEYGALVAAGIEKNALPCPSSL